MRRGVMYNPFAHDAAICSHVVPSDSRGFGFTWLEQAGPSVFVTCVFFSCLPSENISLISLSACTCTYTSSLKACRIHVRERTEAKWYTIYSESGCEGESVYSTEPNLFMHQYQYTTVSCSRWVMFMLSLGSFCIFSTRPDLTPEAECSLHVVHIVQVKCGTI